MVIFAYVFNAILFIIAVGAVIAHYRLWKITKMLKQKEKLLS